MKTKTLEIGGVSWTIRSLTAREKMNGDGLRNSAGFGDQALYCISAGLVGATRDGAELKIPTDRALRQQWLDDYFADDTEPAYKLYIEVFNLSRVTDEGKGLSASQPSS